MTVVRRDVKFDEEKAMRCSLERELQFPPDRRGAFGSKGRTSGSCGATTNRGAESGDIHSSRDIQRRKERTREADRLLQDARENVGAPTSQHRQRRSPDRYTGYMALMSELVETEPSSFEEASEKPSMG
jgi:hypothetical protein